MLQAVLATDTDTEINIIFKNIDVMTSTQIIKLQHVQYETSYFKLSTRK